MSADRVIASPENEVVRRLRRLAQRRDPGAVLLEGPRVVREAIACGVRLELLALREGEAGLSPTELEVPADRVVRLSERAFAAASQTVTPQGVLAVARRADVSVSDALGAARKAGWPLVVLDGVQDPGNVGAICRTAAAAGAPALAVLAGGADAFGPKAVRASAGNVFRIRVARGGWEELEGAEGCGAVARGGVPLDRAAPERADFLALGGEVRGLGGPGSSDGPAGRRLRPVSIPMAAGVESLNVAAAAAVLLFEVRRRLSA